MLRLWAHDTGPERRFETERRWKDNEGMLLEMWEGEMKKEEFWWFVAVNFFAFLTGFKLAMFLK